MLTKTELLKILLDNLRIARNLRASAKNDTPLLNSKVFLKTHQVERLKKTHEDLLMSSDTRDAALFFLNEIYSFKDLSKRDNDLERLLPTLGKMFPESILEVIAKAMILDALTEQLETKMATKLGLSFTKEQYYEAYRQETSYEERLTQLNLVKDLGYSLCGLVKLPFVAPTLKIMAMPARLAKLSEVHDFLNSGFNTFTNTNNPENFINTLVEREKFILDIIFDRGYDWQDHIDTYYKA